MMLINFSLKKKNKYIINEKNIKCISTNKIVFKIKNDKYSFYDNKLVKENDTEIVTLDFNNSNCNIYLKEYNKEMYLKLDKVIINNDNEFTIIEYLIETEIDTINIITIERIKSS